jgi:pilus assembly protein Flp/PilA
MKFSKRLQLADAIQHKSSTRGATAAFLRDESAQDIVEYALIAVFIGLGTVVATRGLAVSIGVAFSNVQTALTSGV